jgi:hypothetical protein
MPPLVTETKTEGQGRWRRNATSCYRN